MLRYLLRLPNRLIHLRYYFQIPVHPDHQSEFHDADGPMLQPPPPCDVGGAHDCDANGPDYRRYNHRRPSDSCRGFSLKVPGACFRM